MKLLEIDQIEIDCWYLEVQCMPIEVRELEKIEFGVQIFLQEIWTNESSVLFEL